MPDPSPAPSTPSTPPLPTCSYQGYFSIRPNSITCGPESKYLSYIYPRCDALRVALLTKRQLYSKVFRAVWSMRGSTNNRTGVETSIKSYKRSDCDTRYLQDIPGSHLRMGMLESQWTILPRGADCYSDVGLWSKFENKWLAMSDSCGAFTFVEDAEPASSFSLLKIKL